MPLAAGPTVLHCLDVPWPPGFTISMTSRCVLANYGEPRYSEHVYYQLANTFLLIHNRFIIKPLTDHREHIHTHAQVASNSSSKHQALSSKQQAVRGTVQFKETRQMHRATNCLALNRSWHYYWPNTHAQGGRSERDDDVTKSLTLTTRSDANNTLQMVRF